MVFDPYQPGETISGTGKAVRGMEGATSVGTTGHGRKGKIQKGEDYIWPETWRS